MLYVYMLGIMHAYNTINTKQINKIESWDNIEVYKMFGYSLVVHCLAR